MVFLATPRSWVRRAVGYYLQRLKSTIGWCYTRPPHSSCQYTRYAPTRPPLLRRTLGPIGPREKSIGQSTRLPASGGASVQFNGVFAAATAPQKLITRFDSKLPESYDVRDFCGFV